MRNSPFELRDLWEQQENFMRLLQQERNFPEFPVDLSSKDGQRLIQNIRHHCMDELHEASICLKNAKSHRLTENPVVDREAYLEELCDAQHLLFEIFIASGFTRQEFCQAYLAKGLVNEERIKGSY